ncbi:MAG: lipopolysaccharide kinase InaA family protein [Planctomycetota bacterium]|jgi:tRNA A-37 threonylcarbamoyl transferase component Bud32
MIEPPFQLLIKNSCSNNRQESLRCLALLRAISGRRRVYDALWNNREVIVKVFPHKISAARHLKREWRGLSLLRERGLNAPEPLFFGKTEDSDLAVVMEKIADSSTAIDVFNRATNPAARFNLLILTCKELAKQHSRGVLQKDLHLGNFLLQGEDLFTVDPAQMRFLPRQASRREAIPQLALLASALTEEDVEELTTLCEEYAAARSWKFSPADMAAFWKKLAAHGKRGIKKGLSKCLDFFEKVDFARLLRNLDDLMRDGQILKDGNTCFVSRINLAGKEIVVKRYNYKGVIHSVRHTLKRSRARRNWLHAHRLVMLNIPTAAPLAFIEKCRLLIVCKSYFITEYIDGRKLCDFLQGDDACEELHLRTVKTVAELLNKLSKHQISHGDMKHSNILITENKPFIIDLDSMTAHKSNWLFNIRRKKDLLKLASHE